MNRAGWIIALVCAPVAFYFAFKWRGAAAQLAALETSSSTAFAAADRGSPEGRGKREDDARKLMSLEDQLKAKDRQIADAHQHLAVVVDALAKLQLESKSFTHQVLDDGTIVYAPGETVFLKNGMTVSSPSGVMVSDQGQSHIDGDLVVARPGTDMLMKMDKAFVTVSGDAVTFDVVVIEPVKSATPTGAPH